MFLRLLAALQLAHAARLRVTDKLQQQAQETQQDQTGAQADRCSTMNWYGRGTGTCTTSCPAGGVRVRGLCPGGADVTCCVTGSLTAAEKSCSSQRGCQSTQQWAQCQTGSYVSGKCPGPSEVKCCEGGGSSPASSPASAPSSSTDYSALVPIPAEWGKTQRGSIKAASNSKVIALLGDQTQCYDAKCFGCQCGGNAPTIVNNKVTMDVGPFRITALRPFAEAVRRAFTNAKRDIPDVVKVVKTAGAYCCRPVKRRDGTASSSLSNHAFGTAIDIYFGRAVDPRGDGKTQRGLLELAPYFNAEGLYWAAGYGGAYEDAMHFEAPAELIAKWKRDGEL